MKSRRKRYNKDYQLVNIILIVLFLIGFVYVAIVEESMTCYYKSVHGTVCNTCGMTRDFKSMIKFDFSYLINPHSTFFFLLFSLFFFTRIGVLISLLKLESPKKVLLFDIVYGTVMVIAVLLI